MGKFGESIKKGVAGIVTAAMLLYAPVAHPQPLYGDLQRSKEKLQQSYKNNVIKTYKKLKMEGANDLPEQILKYRMDLELKRMGALRKYYRTKASGIYGLEYKDILFKIEEGDEDYCKSAEDLMEILKEDEETQNVYEVVQDIYSQNCLNPHTQKEQSDGSTDKPIESYSKAYREALKNTAEDIAKSYERNNGRIYDTRRAIEVEVANLARLKETLEKNKNPDTIRMRSNSWCDAAEDVMTEIKREHLEEREGSHILHRLYQEWCKGKDEIIKNGDLIDF